MLPKLGIPLHVGEKRLARGLESCGQSLTNVELEPVLQVSEEGIVTVTRKGRSVAAL